MIATLSLEGTAHTSLAILSLDWTDAYSVTLLSLLGSNSIAVPLSSGFPAIELRYILTNSEAFMLLSSANFRSKADEIVKGDLDKAPILSQLEKRLGSDTSQKQVQLDDKSKDQAGLMLYTSGTTSRPVSKQISLRVDC